MTNRQLDSHAEGLLRDLAPRVLGAIARRSRDFAASEDAVQSALLAAAEQWPRTGLPDNPRAWLIHVAERRLTDQVRSAIARRQREAGVARETAPTIEPAADAGALDRGRLLADAGMDDDDTLLLLFMCCHPALPAPSAIALTLRAVGGLTTTEIAKAFLVPLATMAQRINRAKQIIRTSGVPLAQPDAAERGERLDLVLRVLYLIFNEGYTASAGVELQRTDLAHEAIRLTRAVHRLLPTDAEVAGLLALMLLTDARRAARSGPQGELVPLDAQDRALWDPAAIAEGIELVSAALRRGAVGEYQLLAAIAAVHDEAPRAAVTDWPQIVALYSVLLRLSDNPLVVLNHAIAVAEVDGPRAGLERLAALDADPRMNASHRLAAVRAHLLERAGEKETATALYRLAAERTTNAPERSYLLMRAARLAET